MKSNPHRQLTKLQRIIENLRLSLWFEGMSCVVCTHMEVCLPVWEQVESRGQVRACSFSLLSSLFEEDHFTEAGTELAVRPIISLSSLPHTGATGMGHQAWILHSCFLVLVLPSGIQSIFHLKHSDNNIKITTTETICVF